MIPADEAWKIRRDYADRIMSGRMVGRWKNPSAKKISERKSKSRLCALGHEDPDLLDLAEERRLAAPTIATTSLRAGLQLAASRGFRVQFADAEQGFLQAKPLKESKARCGRGACS